MPWPGGDLRERSTWVLEVRVGRIRYVGERGLVNSLDGRSRKLGRRKLSLVMVIVDVKEVCSE